MAGCQHHGSSIHLVKQCPAPGQRVAEEDNCNKKTKVCKEKMQACQRQLHVCLDGAPAIHSSVKGDDSRLEVRQGRRGDRRKRAQVGLESRLNQEGLTTGLTGSRLAESFTLPSNQSLPCVPSAGAQRHLGHFGLAGLAPHSSLVQALSSPPPWTAGSATEVKASRSFCDLKSHSFFTSTLNASSATECTTGLPPVSPPPPIGQRPPRAYDGTTCAAGTSPVSPPLRYPSAPSKSGGSDWGGRPLSVLVR